MKKFSYADVIRELRRRGNPRNREGMVRFGIVAKNAFGVSAPVLHKLAGKIGTDHALAKKLYASKYHEAKNLAALVADPARMTEMEMDAWAERFSSWDTCDAGCLYLLSRTNYAWKKAAQWSRWKEEFVRRAGFVMMAVLAVHDKEAGNDAFRKFFPLIERRSTDERNFVKKAVNWALRQIGKRNAALNREAISWAKKIHRKESGPAKWIASNALLELQSPQVQKKVKDEAKTKRKAATNQARR